MFTRHASIPCQLPIDLLRRTDGGASWAIKLHDGDDDDDEDDDGNGDERFGGPFRRFIHACRSTLEGTERKKDDGGDCDEEEELDGDDGYGDCFNGSVQPCKSVAPVVRSM